MSTIKIAIATHKKYEMPKDGMYLPIQSGAILNNEKLGYTPDDTEDNISEKNKNYSELTALYWMWKNEKSDYKGLAHYRRHFSKKKNVSMFSTGRFEEVLDENTLRNKLKNYDIVLPTPRRYYIESVESHYNHTHYEQDLLVTKQIIKDMYPEYSDAYENVLKRNYAHMFNMFIMKSDYFDSYCEWLFSILFELEQRLDISEYSPFHARVYGRVSEILLDVWLTKKQFEYTEVPVMFMEKQDWKGKIFKFLKAKFTNSKY